MALVLFEHPISPYSQKIKILLREKGLTFESRTPLTGPQDSSFNELNPRGEVPAIRHDEFSVYDSRIIAEYLEEVFLEVRLLPSDAKERAKCRRLELIADTQLDAVNYGLSEVTFFNRATGDSAASMVEVAQGDLRQAIAFFEEELGPMSFFGGENPNFADFVIFPHIFISSRHLKDGFNQSNLQKWVTKMKTRPSISRTLFEAIDAAEHLSDLKEHIAAGKNSRLYRDHRLEWIIRAGGISIVEAGLKAKTIRLSAPIRATKHK